MERSVEDRDSGRAIVTEVDCTVSGSGGRRQVDDGQAVAGGWAAVGAQGCIRISV